MKLIPVIVLASLPTILTAQDTSAIKKDTSLPGITVYAYGQHRSLLLIPASVVSLTSQQKSRFNNINVIQALNTLSGVRIEERSPASYRINIRGSSLRAPFGVRNIRVYYNDIPLTDPSGFTYFNQLGYLQTSNVDIIKGPGSSLYGAGNGGVLLINTNEKITDGATVSYTAGSFGLHNINTSLNFTTGNRHHNVSYQYTRSNGYREHSEMKRNVVSLNSELLKGKETLLSAHMLFNDLFYETPGGLTLTEFEANPRQARPRVGNVPGAIENNASIKQSNFLAGLVLKQTITNRLKNTTSLYGTWSTIYNPTIRNYSRSEEPHWGGRSVFSHITDLKRLRIQFLGGVELQQQYTESSIYLNKNGHADSLQTISNTHVTQHTEFLQATLVYNRLTIETGLSISSTDVNLKTNRLKYRSDLETSPRIALLFQTGQLTHPYINVARGFSPPTVAELAPTGSSTNLNLRPEAGWNYEFGIRRKSSNNRLHFDINAFYFQLSNALVLRRDSSGGDNYINAGRTKQFGLEASANYSIFNDTARKNNLLIWTSGNYYAFRYVDFVQLDNNYSGNKLPGIPTLTFNAGLDVKLNRLKLFLTYTYTSRMMLNDANDVSVANLNLLGMRSEYDVTIRKLVLSVFLGADNILDTSYSLGYDVNAAGNRYYNSSGGRHLYLGTKLLISKYKTAD